jgi:predicted permease
MALGSARIGLVRQMLTESVLLGCFGGLAGLLVAYAGTRGILALAFPGADTLPIQASPSLPVLGFAFALSLLTGIVFGVAPAWFNSHSEPAEALRGLNRATRDRSSFPQKSLIVLQTALALVLLAGAGLLTESLRNLERQRLGLSTDNRYVVHLDPAGSGYTAQRLPALYQQIEQRFNSTPGVQSVGLALFSPLEGGTWGDCVFVEGRPAPGPNDNCGSGWDRVSQQFFQAVGQPILRGRGITELDTPTSQFVAVVNQAFVKKFFPGEDPIGKHFGTNGEAYAGNFEIVGVVADAKYGNPRGEFAPMFFRALSQQLTTYKEAGAMTGENRSMFIDSVILNFGGRQQNADSLVRHVLASIDPNLPITDFQSLNDQIAGNFNQERLIARLTMLFGLLALGLASVGLYGVTAYAVGRRTSEIGVRMALGASPGSVVSMVLRAAILQIMVGLAIGIPATFLIGRLLENQLYGIHSGNLPVLSVAIVILAASAALAGFIPARRASKVDPMVALRYE